MEKSRLTQLPLFTPGPPFTNKPLMRVLWNQSRPVSCYVTLVTTPIAVSRTMGLLLSRCHSHWTVHSYKDISRYRDKNSLIGQVTRIRGSATYRGFCSSSCVSMGSGVFVAPLSFSFLPDGLFTSVFSAAVRFVTLSLPPDLDDADCGLTVSGSSTSGKRAYSEMASFGILPKIKKRSKTMLFSPIFTLYATHFSLNLILFCIFKHGSTVHISLKFPNSWDRETFEKHRQPLSVIWPQYLPYNQRNVGTIWHCPRIRP